MDDVIFPFFLFVQSTKYVVNTFTFPHFLLQGEPKTVATRATPGTCVVGGSGGSAGWAP
jgi:hypothetical protein